ncbi:MAG TPA: hypothetical protein GXZ23_01605 [Clostridiales bacterium]|nr:hypothetical protein [Clostridiales bacterium]
MKQKVLAIILCFLMIGSSMSLIGFVNADPPNSPPMVNGFRCESVTRQDNGLYTFRFSWNDNGHTGHFEVWGTRNPYSPPGSNNWIFCMTTGRLGEGGYGPPITSENGRIWTSDMELAGDTMVPGDTIYLSASSLEFGENYEETFSDPSNVVSVELTEDGGEIDNSEEPSSTPPTTETPTTATPPTTPTTAPPTSAPPTSATPPTEKPTEGGGYVIITTQPPPTAPPTAPPTVPTTAKKPTKPTEKPTEKPTNSNKCKHDWDDWDYYTDMKHERVCKKCNAHQIESCTLGDPEIKDGKEYRQCTKCLFTYERKHFHDMGAWTKNGETGHIRKCQVTGCSYEETANCTMTIITENDKKYRKCTVCDRKDELTKEELEDEQQKDADREKITGGDPDCPHLSLVYVYNGGKKHMAYCSKCNGVLPATACRFRVIERFDASCVTGSGRTERCSLCEHIEEYVNDDQLEHEFIYVSKGGNKHERKCKTCNTQTTIENCTGVGVVHIVSEATCQVGKKTRTQCAKCNGDVIETDSQVGSHKYADFDRGVGSRKCIWCGEIDSCEHSFNIITRKEATCTQKGLFDRKCAKCGYSEIGLVENELGHDIYGSRIYPGTGTHHYYYCTREGCNKRIYYPHYCNKEDYDLYKTYYFCAVCNQKIMKNNNRPEDKDKDKGGGSGSTNHGNTGCPHQWIVSNTPPTATTHEVTCNKCNLTRNENHDFTYSCVSDSIHQAYCKICKCTVNQEHAFDIMFDENGELAIRKEGDKYIGTSACVCGKERTWEAKNYEEVSAHVTANTGNAFGIWVNKEFENFNGALLDDEPLFHGGDYDGKRGSTIIELSELVFSTIEPGTHTLTLFFEDGYFETEFVIAAGIGDVNRDGQIKPTDARLALRAALSLETLSDISGWAADFNENKKVETTDARRILRVALGLEKLYKEEVKEENLKRLT